MLLYTNAEQERNIYFEYKDSFLKRNKDFLERYFALVRNLDEESIHTVNTILKRLECLFATEEKKLDLFSEKEACDLQRMKQDFKDRIFKINDMLFAYGSHYLPKNFFDNGVWYYKYGLNYVRDMAVVRNGDILDLGAFIGDSSIFFMKYTDRNVYAVEAQKDNCKLLEQTISLNRTDNIKIVNCAVSDHIGRGYIHHCENANLGTLNPYAGRQYQDKEEISIDTVDHIVKEYGMNVSLIKADIEGSESAMLRGAVETLKKYRPIILI